MTEVSNQQKLVGVNQKLVDVVKDLQTYSTLSIAVMEGLRSLETQQTYVMKGLSKTMDSKHLKQADGTGHAVDLGIIITDGGVKRVLGSKKDDDLRPYYYLAGVVHVVSQSCGVLLRWGGDWSNDGIFNDQTFNDLVHWELLK